MTLSGLVEKVHKLHGLGLEVVHHLIDTRHKIIVGKQCDNADDKTCDSGDKSRIDAVGEHRDIGTRSCRREIEEGVDHTDYRTEKSYHRTSGSRGGKPRETFLKIGNLDITGILDSDEHIVHRTAYTRDTLEDETGIRSVGTVAEVARPLKATPVGMKVEFDPDANNVTTELGKYTITPAIDFHALGTASTAEQNRAREAKGKAPLSKGQSDRIKVVTSFPVTKDGLGGMNNERVSQNLAKCAAANGLMSTTDPTALPTADQVKTVSDLYAKTFNDLVDQLAKKGSKGVTVAGIKDPNKTVSCPSLEAMGIRADVVNGARVLTVVGGEDSKQARRDGLAQFNEVFNAKWKQVVNERDPKDASKYVHDAATVSLGNQMSLNSRAVTVRNPQDRNLKTGLVLVQPGMDFTSTPYADKLGMSVGSAMHGLLDGTTPESLYSKEMLDAASKLSVAFDTPSLPQVEAVKANQAQFDAICKKTGKDPVETLKAPAKSDAQESVESDREME